MHQIITDLTLLMPGIPMFGAFTLAIRELKRR